LQGGRRIEQIQWNLLAEQAEKHEASEDVVHGKGFFILNLLQVERMVQQGAGAEEVMAYLVLVRGTSARRKGVTTHGANSIATRSGMTYYRAEHALDWLASAGYINKLVDDTDPPTKKRKARWRIIENPDVLELPLANSLLDGIGRGKEHPPLERIYNNVSLGKHLVMADARLDTLMVLLRLYLHHSLADFGGVNPRSGVSRQWVATENSGGERVMDLENTNAALYEIGGGNQMVYGKFPLEALPYITDEAERELRFWDAFQNLSRFGFVYEVIQVWSADPEKSKKAEPLYTLYVKDRHAREQEPYLSHEIHNAAFRRGALEFCVEFPDGGEDDLDETRNIVGTGRFRYIAARKSGGFPIGIYRLRFRPHTRDTSKGMAAEQRRVNEWGQCLHDL
jgi:hypothetical protein